MARKPDSVVISIYMNLNLDYLLQKMWEYMGLIRIYTKRRAQPPDLTAPIVLSSERHGLTVEAASGSISKVRCILHECMYVSIYVHVDISNCKKNIRICIYVYMYVCTYRNIQYSFKYINVCTYLYTYECMYECLHSCSIFYYQI